jgi:hypothetical protein
MLALLCLVSGKARAIDLLLGVPIRSDPFSAFTTEVVNGVSFEEDAAVRTVFFGELSAAIPLDDVASSAEWIVDVGLREWMGDGPRVDFAAHEPHADVGLHLGTRRDEVLHAYAGMGVGVLVSFVTSSEWRTFSLVSPHAFLSAGLAYGGATKALVELRISPVLRNDTYTRAAQLEEGGVGVRFTPGGVALTFAAGVRFP